MFKFSLTRQFSAILLTIVFLLGLLITYGATVIIRGQTLGLIAHITGEYARDMIEGTLPAGFFHQEPGPVQYRHIDQKRKRLSHNIVRLKVWDNKGRVIYSDDKEIIGRVFEIEADLKDALQGRTSYSVTDLNEPEHINDRGKFEQLVEVYVPVWASDGGEVLGAYELYWDFSEISASIRDSYKYLWLMLSGGFMVIYFSLLATFRRASRTLDSQSRALRTMIRRLKQSVEEKLSTLIAALDAKDNYTAGHSLRVADYSLQLGRAIGLSAEKLKVLEQAALLHDIGKIGVPEQILNKPSPLNEEEAAIMKQHPVTGAYIIKQSTALSAVAEIIRHHHEQYDGSGYPDGLRAEEIPLEARIMAIADTFDAMTTDRPYRRGLPPEEALERIARAGGTQFEPQLVKIFTEILVK